MKLLDVGVADSVSDLPGEAGGGEEEKEKFSTRNPELSLWELTGTGWVIP